MKKKLWLALTIIIWIIFAGIMSLTYYVNHYMPDGHMYATGDIVCMNDGRDCGPEYKEDLTNVDIPNWARFFKGDGPILLLFGIGTVGVIAGNKYKKSKK
ncbi:hypothetical protein C0416_01365 [bacterium]|nr:hypothetical protein [bacterium]